MWYYNEDSSTIPSFAQEAGFISLRDLLDRAMAILSIYNDKGTA